jgi:predicted nucleic-acid-binding Zn-ribbon protein
MKYTSYCTICRKIQSHIVKTIMIKHKKYLNMECEECHHSEKMICDINEIRESK